MTLLSTMHIGHVTVVVPVGNSLISRNTSFVRIVHDRCVHWLLVGYASNGCARRAPVLKDVTARCTL